jgi:hypothetical protein
LFSRKYHQDVVVYGRRSHSQQPNTSASKEGVYLAIRVVLEHICDSYYLIALVNPSVDKQQVQTLKNNEQQLLLGKLSCHEILKLVKHHP